MDNAMHTGELMYELALQFTAIDEFGVSFGGLLSGQETPPPEGARFDAHVTGTAKGKGVDCTVEGTDYLAVRADGKFILHIHGAMTAATGERVSFFIPGQGFVGDDGFFYLREMIEHHTSHEPFKWMNMMNGFIEGKVNPGTGELAIKVFAVR